ncbi:MAG: hypothetical protein IJC13_09020 [Clostridia bacterium]|nr:hypothetical protein [Clostridia bacterium]
MKRKIKQILSALLALVMLVGIVPLADLDVAASALEINGSISFADGKYVLDENGTLTVTGTGTFLASEMYYYLYQQSVDIAVNNYLGQVKKIVIKDGFTDIYGEFPINQLNNCVSIVIPTSVTNVSDETGRIPIICYEGSEGDWEKVENSIPKNQIVYNYDCKYVATISFADGKYIFDENGTLTVTRTDSFYAPEMYFYMYLGDGGCLYNALSLVKKIILDTEIIRISSAPSQYMQYMRNWTDIVVPISVTQIDESAFGNNYGTLLNVYYEGSEEDWNRINIEDGNEQLLTYSSIHYNYRQDIQNVDYLQQEDTHKDFTVTANGRQQMIQFIEPDGGTRTYDRYNKNVSITSYNADGEVVSELSRDLAYEVWNIHSNMSVGVEIKVRGKENYVWDSAEYSFTIEPYNPIVSMELSTTSGKKGPVPATVVADEKTEKVMFKMPNNTSVTVASTATDENGNKIFTGNAWMNEDGLNEIEVKIYRKNIWKTVGTLEYTAE